MNENTANPITSLNQVQDPLTTTTTTQTIATDTITTPVEVFDPMATVSPVEKSTSLGNNNIPIPPIPPVVENKPKKKFLSKKILFVFGMILFLFLVLFGFGSVGVLAAYSKIQLPGNLNIQLRDVVQSIPFAPKTPDYVFAKMIEAHSLSTKVEFKSNLTAKSDSANPQWKSLTNSDEVNLSLSGKVDYSNKNIVKSSSFLDLTEVLSLETTIIGDDFYLKITRFPMNLLSQLGMGIDLSGIDKVLVNRWIKISTNYLEDRVDQEKPETPSEIATKQIENISNLMSKIVMTKENIDGSSVYKFSLELTPQELCKFIDAESPCDEAEMQNMLYGVLLPTQILITVDANSYLTKNVNVIVGVEYDPNSLYGVALSPTGSTPPPSLGAQKETLTFETNIDLSNYNQDQNIEAPTDAVSEDVIQQEMEQFMMQKMGGSLPTGTGMEVPATETDSEDDFSGFE